LFNGLANAKNFDACERLHEFDGGSMADFEADQAIGLGEDEIGGQELGFSFEQLSIDRCCGGMILVIFVSQGKKCTGIQKDFQG
jgi:hypothetical protein